MSSCCSGKTGGQTVLLYACSGGANVAEIADRAGLTNYVQVKVTDLGIEKTKCVRAADSEVARVVAKAKEVMAKA